MSRGLVFVVFLISALLTDRVASIDWGSMCNEDTDCNSVENSRCLKVVTVCPTGFCACASGYRHLVMTDGSCAAKKDYGDTCIEDMECLKDVFGSPDLWDQFVCGEVSNKCECGTATYSPIYKICLSPGKKALGESGCIADIDCNEVNDTECTGGTCVCKPGYVAHQDLQFCRQPVAGESCTTGVGCIQVPMPNTTDTTQQEPTCTDDKCVCGVGETEVEVPTETDFPINDLKMCVTKATDRLSVGEQCTQHNDCQSYMCSNLCPGSTSSICIGLPNCTAPVVGSATYIPVQDSYSDGQTVTYTCVTGYTHAAGDLILTCDNAGDWVGTTPSCSTANKASAQTHVSGLLVASLLLLGNYSI